MFAFLGKRRTHTDETRAKISTSLKAHFTDEFLQSEEWAEIRAKNSAAQKALWADPKRADEQRARISGALRAHFSNEHLQSAEWAEIRGKMSEAHKARYADGYKGSAANADRIAKGAATRRASLPERKKSEKYKESLERHAESRRKAAKKFSSDAFKKTPGYKRQQEGVARGRVTATANSVANALTRALAKWDFSMASGELQRVREEAVNEDATRASRIAARDRLDAIERGSNGDIKAKRKVLRNLTAKRFIVFPDQFRNRPKRPSGKRKADEVDVEEADGVAVEDEDE